MCLRMADRSKLYLVNRCIGRTRMSASRNLCRCLQNKKTLYRMQIGGNVYKPIAVKLIEYGQFLRVISSCFMLRNLTLAKSDFTTSIRNHISMLTYYIPFAIHTTLNMRWTAHCFGSNPYNNSDIKLAPHSTSYTVQKCRQS